MAERIRALWERLKADVQRNPGLWIGVGISAVILVIAYLAYRKNQLNSSAVVPANGYGIPNYGTSSGGSSDTGLTYPGYSPYQPASPSVPISPVSSPVSSPATAFPAFPPFNLSAPAPASPFAPVARTIAGSIQNPTAAQTAQHVGTVTAIQGNIQNPTAAQDIAHRGSLPTAPTSYIVPTTIRPRTVTTRGRVA